MAGEHLAKDMERKRNSIPTSPSLNDGDSCSMTGATPHVTLNSEIGELGRPWDEFEGEYRGIQR